MFPEVGWDRALCLELLNTRGWAREGACDESKLADSFSREEGVFPNSTAKSILGGEGERMRPRLLRPSVPYSGFLSLTLHPQRSTSQRTGLDDMDVNAHGL